MRFRIFTTLFLLFLLQSYLSTRVSPRDRRKITSDLRDPFKCPGCNLYFSSTVDEEAPPVHLIGCSHTMCMECVKVKRTPNEGVQPGGKPFLLKCALCPRVTGIREEPPVSLAFLDSYTGATVPRVLCCGHALCQTCVDKKKRKLHREYIHLYEIECLKCDGVTSFSDNLTGAAIEDVIKWLDGNNEKVDPSDPRGRFECSTCGEKTSSDRGILCTDCTQNGEKKPELCGFCAFKSHQGHTTEMLLPQKLDSMASKATTEIQSMIVKCNLDGREVADTYKRLLKRVEKSFYTIIRTIPSSEKYSDGLEIGVSLKRKAENYEGIMEKIVFSARGHHEMLEDILKELEDESDGESKENAETEEGQREKKRRRVEDADKQRDSDGEKGETEA